MLRRDDWGWGIDAAGCVSVASVSEPKMILVDDVQHSLIGGLEMHVYFVQHMRGVEVVRMPPPPQDPFELALSHGAEEREKMGPRGFEGFALKKPINKASDRRTAMDEEGGYLDGTNEGNEEMEEADGTYYGSRGVFPSTPLLEGSFELLLLFLLLVCEPCCNQYG